MLRKGHILAILLIGVCVTTFLSISAQQNYDIPAWVKGVAGFWAEDKISDQEFGEGLSFLISSNIVKVPEMESLKQKVTQLESENAQLKNQLGSFESPPSTTFTSGTGTYTNNLYGFTFNYPKNWEIEENPETTVYGEAGIVSGTRYVGASYEPGFIVHFFNSEDYERSLAKNNDEQGLLDFYSDLTYLPEASQVKYLDKSIEKTNFGYTISIKTTDVSHFPEEYIDGEWFPEEFISLITEFVFIIYSDGEEYEIIFTAEPSDYEKNIKDFEKMIDSFKRI